MAGRELRGVIQWNIPTPGWYIPYLLCHSCNVLHNDVIIWKRFPNYWPFVRTSHWLLVVSDNKVLVMRNEVFFVVSFNKFWTKSFTSDFRRDDAHVIWQNFNIVFTELGKCRPFDECLVPFCAGVPKVFKITTNGATSDDTFIFCVVNSPVTGEFSSQGPVMRSFGVFYVLRLNKRLSKRSKRRWFEAPSRSLWRHCNVIIYMLWLQYFDIGKH